MADFISNAGNWLKGRVYGSPNISKVRTQQKDLAGQIGGLRTNYSGMAQHGGAGAVSVAPQRMAAFGNAMNYLNNDVGGDARDSIALSRGAGNIADARDAGAARIGAYNRRTGITGGAEAGALAANEAGAQRAGAQMNTAVALGAIDRNRQNKMGAYQLAGGEYDRYSNELTRGTQGEAGLIQQEFGQLDRIAGQEEAAKNAYNQNMMSTITGLGDIVGKFTKRSMPEPSNAPAGFQFAGEYDGYSWFHDPVNNRWKRGQPVGGL